MRIFCQARSAAYEIINRKCCSSRAIGLVPAHLVRTIQEDQGSVLPISVRPHGEYGIEDVCFRVPVSHIAFYEQLDSGAGYPFKLYIQKFLQGRRLFDEHQGHQFTIYPDDL